MALRCMTFAPLLKVEKNNEVSTTSNTLPRHQKAIAIARCHFGEGIAKAKVGRERFLKKGGVCGDGVCTSESDEDCAEDERGCDRD